MSRWASREQRAGQPLLATGSRGGCSRSKPTARGEHPKSNALGTPMANTRPRYKAQGQPWALGDGGLLRGRGEAAQHRGRGCCCPALTWERVGMPARKHGGC